MTHRGAERGHTVLVYRIGQLGDTLISLPAMHCVRQRFPAAALVLLTDTHRSNVHVSSWDILRHTGWFDDVLFYPARRGRLHTVAAMMRLALRIRRLAPRTLCYLTPGRRSAKQMARDGLFFQRLCGIPEILGLIPHTHPAKTGTAMPRVEPEWQRLLKLVQTSTTPCTDSDARLTPPNHVTLKAAARLAEAGLHGDERYAVLAPGSKMAAKRWPADYFEALAQRLLTERLTDKLVVLGGPEDHALGARLAAAVGPRLLNLAGATSILESAAVLAGSRAYIGNDTGTMHLAAAVGTPCVALFSARDYPGLWEPYGTGHVVLRHDLDCAGCMLETCEERDNECLRRIVPDLVYDACCKVLNVG